jgi:hypothetical protein
MLQPLQLQVAVSMDHGIAIFPQDAEQADQLIRIADERLYRQKHANHKKTAEGADRAETAPSADETPGPAASLESPGPLPPPISIEAKHVPEQPESDIDARAAISPTPAPAPVIPTPRMFPVQRKAERVSMAGTNAYAVLGEQGALRARVLDLGFGGVAIELDSQETLPETLFAVLHVPILPPVRVNLKPVWRQQTALGGTRIGCSFVS